MDHLIDDLWLLVAATLVLSMQAGFLLVEGGRVRSKNSINVAQKNVTDLVVAWVCFSVAGFWLMYGTPSPALGAALGAAGAAEPLRFVYQIGFCATAVTLASGAVAERMRFSAYLWMSCLVSLAVYPLVGRLVWGHHLGTGSGAWLAELGFVDFAGATVVHGVGAWTGLVAALVLGPRIGRFDGNGRPRPLARHSSVIALLGTLVLLLGWIGFNGGGVAGSDPRLGSIVVGTLGAAAFGALAGLLLGHRLSGTFDPSATGNGLIGGLVASAAGVHLMGGLDAPIVGALGGLVAVGGAHWLLHRRRLDDPLDVVACHGLAGAVGTLAVAFVAPVEALPAGSRLAQLGVQAAGVAAVLALVVATVRLGLLAISRVVPLRVDAEEERLGLNRAEHGESIGTGRLQLALEERLAGAPGSGSSGPSDEAGLDVGEDDENGELAATLGRLLGRQERALDVLRASETRFRRLAETSSEWLWETDERLIVSYMSPNPSHPGSTLGEGAVGRHLFDLLGVEPSVRRDVLERIVRRRPTEVFAGQVESVDGAAPLHAEIRGVPSHDAEGRYIGYRGTVVDIGPRKAAEERTRFLSRHDELTGLPDRRALPESLEAALDRADRAGEAVVVASIDLDGFASVNDACGHAAGDELLQRLALAMREGLAEDDPLFRTGGDEFVALIRGLDVRDALERGEREIGRMVARVGGDHELVGTRVRASASAGLVAYPEQTRDGAEALRMAALALCAAKAAGRGTVRAFEPHMNAELQRRLDMERDLAEAVTAGRFHVDYQPLVDARSEALVGLEALVRWDHPERGRLQPVDFVDAAERLDMMGAIGELVLGEACAFAATWEPDPSGDVPRLAINVSPQQFRAEGFVDAVRDALVRTGLAPERLELEIGEEAMTHDLDRVAATLLALRAMGVSIAVDDFGGGRTALPHLGLFPVTTLKIDRAYVRHLDTDVKAREIAESIVRLGRKLGMRTVAAGVEEPRHLALLREWGCDQVQGFLFSKPLDADDVSRLLAARREDAGIGRAVG